MLQLFLLLLLLKKNSLHKNKTRKIIKQKKKNILFVKIYRIKIFFLCEIMDFFKTKECLSGRLLWWRVVKLVGLGVCRGGEMYFFYCQFSFATFVNLSAFIKQQSIFYWSKHRMNSFGPLCISWMFSTVQLNNYISRDKKRLNKLNSKCIIMKIFAINECIMKMSIISIHILAFIIINLIAHSNNI